MPIPLSGTDKIPAKHAYLSVFGQKSNWLSVFKYNGAYLCLAGILFETLLYKIAGFANWWDCVAGLYFYFKNWYNYNRNSVVQSFFYNNDLKIVFMGG